MINRVTRDHVFYAFSPTLKPVLHIQQGEEAVLETHDCFEGQLKTDQDLLDTLDWSHVNPATGPVYIEGTKPGDILRVDLLEVGVEGNAVVCAVPGEGVLGDIVSPMETSIMKYRDGKVIFKDKIAIPVNTMIGVIGVAPKEGEIANGVPDTHGGNMDCTLMTQGASLYLTVNVEGALFGCGDMHAVMGDGEVVVCGAETPGMLRFQARVIPALKGLPTPFLENEQWVAAIASADTADEAANLAVHQMARFLTEFAGLSANDAGMLMSLVGWLKFCQVVDPKKTARFEFPKSVLREVGYTMPA